MKGATLVVKEGYTDTINFNPRTREGCDPEFGHKAPGNSISIHAPVKGATYEIGIPKGVSKISIHAPVKGATQVQR